MTVISKVHDYYTPVGGEFGNLPATLAMQHLRMEPKSFLYRWPNPYSPTGWTWRMPPWADYMLYGLEKLWPIKTARESAKWCVYLCEGERDADSISALGSPRVVAVAHHGGAGKFTAAQAAYFEGWLGRVVVCADMDPAGAACALARYDRLRAVGIRPSRLAIHYPAGKYLPGRDMSDHLRDGHPLTDLIPANLERLRKRVQRMTPAERHDGSGWKTGDPDVDNTVLARDWTPRSLGIEESA